MPAILVIKYSMFSPLPPCTIYPSVMSTLRKSVLSSISAGDVSQTFVSESNVMVFISYLDSIFLHPKI